MGDKNNIHLSPTTTANWHELLTEVTLAKKIKLPEEIESYLVFLLIRFTEKIEIADTIIAIEYIESLLETAGSNLRNQKLRDVGDTCLVFSGLFPEIASKRLVNLSYYVKIGQNAYLEISQNNINNNFSGFKKLYEMLANNFIKIIDILHNIRSQNRNFNSKLEAIEIFNNFKDDTLIKNKYKEDFANKIILHSPRQMQ